MLFSVIVPVYNAEKFLRECIESIINQTEQGFELILVNDGSTDNSKNICLDYRLQYKNIKYLEISNSGVSVARNTGIEVAEGDYLLFCDSDDYWSPKLLETLKSYVASGSYDMINFGHCVDRYENGKKIGSYTRSVPEKMEINEDEWKEKLRYYWNSDIGKLATWDKAIRRQLITNKDIRYNCGQVILEDFDFVLQNWSVSQKILLLPDILYHFRSEIEHDGVMRRAKANLYEDLDHTVQHFILFLKEKNVTKEKFPESDEFIFTTYATALERIKGSRSDDKTVCNVVTSLMKNPIFLEIGQPFWGKRIKIINYLCKYKLYRLMIWYMKHIY